MKRLAAGALVIVLLAVAMALALRPHRAVTVPAAPDLETAAIARGLVPDPAARDIVGLYARDTDRLCIVAAGDGHRIGASVDYGDGIACEGAGPVTRSGDSLAITLGEGCAFEARFDGDRIVFPAQLPADCRKLCARRAAFSALDVTRLSGSGSEAAAMRSPRGRLPCGAHAS